MLGFAPCISVSVKEINVPSIPQNTKFKDILFHGTSETEISISTSDYLKQSSSDHTHRTTRGQCKLEKINYIKKKIKTVLKLNC